MNSQREEELKPLPCPFCGNKPEWEYHEDPTYPQVECRNIECPIGMTNDQVSLESWNTRQAATEQGVGEAVAYMVTQSGDFCFATQHRPSISPEEMSDSELAIVPLYTHPPKPTGGGVPECKPLARNLVVSCSTCLKAPEDSCPKYCVNGAGDHKNKAIMGDL